MMQIEENTESKQGIRLLKKTRKTNIYTDNISARPPRKETERVTRDRVVDRVLIQAA